MFRGKFLVLATMVAVLALTLAGCGPSEESGTGGPGGEAGTQPLPETEKEAEADASSSENGEQEGQQAKESGESEQTEQQNKQDEEDTADSGKGEGGESDDRPEDMVKLDPDLPNPMFAGTPRVFASDILDPDTGKKREDVYVPKGMRENVAGGKPVSASSEPIMGKLSQVTDGDRSGQAGSHMSLPPGKQWVQIDLEKKYKIAAILVWHFHSHARVYHDIIVQVSNDQNFEEGVTTLYNNDHDNSLGMGAGDNYEYVETNQGRLIKADGVEARYVRLYSNGNTSNSMNHYVEAAVYGKPAK